MASGLAEVHYTRRLPDEHVTIVDLRATPEAESLYRSLGFTDVDTVTLRLRL